MPINPVVMPMQPMVEPARSGLGDIFYPVADKVEAGAIEKSEIAKNERVALLIAGVSYPRPSQGNKLDPKTHRTYFKLALNYKTHLLANNLVDKVLVFDFLLGKFVAFVKGGKKDGEAQHPLRDPIRVNNYRYNKNGTLTLKAPSKDDRQLYYTGINELAKDLTNKEDGDVPKKDYDPWNGAKENSMSVSDLYERIRFSIGGSIREVHFIGHAWLGGPIIVNTPAYTKKKYDKDCRVGDFTNSDLSQVFDAQNLPHFLAAFTADATLTVWGCENNKEARDLILAAKAKEKGGKSFDDELKQIKEILAKTYAANLAKIAKKNVYAALPGTYSVHEGEPNDDASAYSFAPTVMHVNLEKCEHLLQFYKKHLGITFPTTVAFKGHPTFGRGYAIYKP